MNRKFFIGALCVISIFFLLSCNNKEKLAEGYTPGKAQSGLNTAIITCNNVSISVELAQTDKQREIGLMHRKALDDGKGMLFVFEAEEELSFWMKNTLIPLSIAYISTDGTIRTIKDMTPLSLSSVSSDHFVKYALEVSQGFFSRVGIKEGDRFDLSAIK